MVMEGYRLVSLVCARLLDSTLHCTLLNFPASIGATTVGTEGDWSPTFKLGDQQCINGPLNFLDIDIVFKKQEISQQVLFHNST